MADLNGVFAFTAVGPDGIESIAGFRHPTQPDVMVPLVAPNLEMMEQFRPLAVALAKAMKQPVKLVKFGAREELESIS